MRRKTNPVCDCDSSGQITTRQVVQENAKRKYRRSRNLIPHLLKRQPWAEEGIEKGVFHDICAEIAKDYLQKYNKHNPFSKIIIN